MGVSQGVGDLGAQPCDFAVVTVLAVASSDEDEGLVAESRVIFGRRLPVRAGPCRAAAGSSPRSVRHRRSQPTTGAIGSVAGEAFRRGRDPRRCPANRPVKSPSVTVCLRESAAASVWAASWTAAARG